MFPETIEWLVNGWAKAKAVFDRALVKDAVECHYYN